ncbi:MAG: glycosyltransferase [Candidatus Omnitrophica bacterium]|nr:glycosyltransferase [Candidatus Omnitrophota bacterium]
MKISIVTPSFNQGEFIEEAIQSVLSQGHPDVEHIIVDNCSTDNTAKVLARYPHLKVICEPDQGQSDALNKGFRLATGDVIGWLNADDRYLQLCFYNALNAFAEHQAYDVVYGDYRLVDAQGEVIRIRKELGFDLFMLKYLHILYIPTTTSFFRRRIFQTCHFLNIDYHYAMDYEFFLRLAEGGHRFLHVPKVMADFRWHEDAKSQKQTGKQDEERERALLTHDMFLAGIQGPLRPVMRFILMMIARAKRTVLKLCRGAY